jgi:hypothetical protein
MTQSIPAKSRLGSGPSKGSSDKNRIAAGVCRMTPARRVNSSDSIEVPSHTFGSGHFPAASNAGASAQPGRLGGDRAAEVATRLV